MSIYDSSREKLVTPNTNSYSGREISKPHLELSLNDLQALPNLNSKSSTLPPVSFHAHTNFSGTESSQTQTKAFHQTQIEQLILWKNMLSLLDTHILEHNIQLDIAQADAINRQDPKNLNEDDSYLEEEIIRLKEKLFEISTKNSIKEKALDSINSATQYLKKLYSEEGRVTDFQRTASKHQALDIEAMSLVNEISKKERTLFQLEEEISAEAVANRVKFEQLEKLKSELAEKERDNISKAMNSLSLGKSKEQSTSDQIKLKKRHITTLQHIITGLVLNSSIEWHLDPELQEAMLDPVFPKDI